MFRPARSDHFMISLVTAGEMRVKFTLIDYNLQKNNLFIIAPGVVHQFVEKKDFLVMAMVLQPNFGSMTIGVGEIGSINIMRSVLLLFQP